MKSIIPKSAGRILLLGTCLATPPLVHAAPLTQHEVQKLLASDGAEEDWYGYSVAISGDTAVIGAPVNDDNGENSGSAYVFTRDARGVWSKQAKLLASEGSRFDSFGNSVAISGDTAVIGVYGDDDNGDESGSAYVFTRDSSGVWSERAKLLASDGARRDNFGWSVAISGDTVLIGARLDDNIDEDSGSAYVYSRDASGTWSEQAKLLASGATRGDWYGYSVAISGDMAVVGGFGDNQEVHRAAYVYTRDASGAWSEQGKLLANDGAVGDRFGTSVAISGDTVVVGAAAVIPWWSGPPR